LPYIKKEDRKNLDWISDNLSAELGMKGVTGSLNYFLYRTFKKLKKLGYINNYKTYSRFLAELHESEEEIRRRELAPYEDEAIERNGDVDCI
jgi:hypothetical protein